MPAHEPPLMVSVVSCRAHDAPAVTDTGSATPLNNKLSPLVTVASEFALSVSVVLAQLTICPMLTAPPP